VRSPEEQAPNDRAAVWVPCLEPWIGMVTPARPANDWVVPWSQPWAALGDHVVKRYRR